MPTSLKDDQRRNHRVQLKTYLELLLIAVTAFTIIFTMTWRTTGQGGNGTVATVSAASYTAPVAPDSIAAAFGTKLATGNGSAISLPLPTELAGTTVKVNGEPVPLFFVSPLQVNFLIPAGTAPGTATVVVQAGDKTVSAGTVQVKQTAPAIFTLNASGSGLPAAYVLRVRSGSQIYEPIDQPVSLGPSNDQVFLILYLTGIRKASGIRLMLGAREIDLQAPDNYAGPAPGFVGLDQINALIPREVSGRGLTSLQVTALDSTPSNVAEVDVAGPDGKAATRTMVSSSANSSVFGQSVALTAQVNAMATGAGIPTGTVTFKDGGTTLGATELNASGTATFLSRSLTVGAHNVIAEYVGTTKFKPSASNLDGGQKVSVATVTSASDDVCPGLSSGLQYYPLPRPVRLLDTRPGFQACDHPGAPLTGGATHPEAARANCEGITIPAAAQAIVGNATVVNQDSAGKTVSGGGYVTLYPSGAALPTASNLNFVAGQVVPNAFTVGLGSDGAFNIFASGATHFIIDITGYYAPPGTGGLYYHPLPRPVRLLDTRPGLTGSGGLVCDTPSAALAAGATRPEAARVNCADLSIPAAAQAVVGNATVVNLDANGKSLSAGGYVTLYPSGVAQPTVSNLNFGANQIVANAFTVGLGADGKFNIFTSGSTHFIIDLTGYYSPEPMDVHGSGLLYQPLLSPIRLLDTRPGEQPCENPGAALTGGDPARAQQVRMCHEVSLIPASAQTIVGNATAVNSDPGSGYSRTVSEGGYVTLYPSGVERPTVSNLNFGPNQVVANSFTVGLGADGKFNIFAQRKTHFIIDLTGYYAPLGSVTNKAPTSVVVTSSPAGQVVRGQAVTLTATVMSNPACSVKPTGSVQFKDNGVPLGSPITLVDGSASLTTSALNVGPHQITAEYGGDSNFSGSNGTLSGGQVVNKASTTLALTSSANLPPVVGQSVTFTAQVGVVAPGAGTPTGAVTLTENGVRLGSGTLNAAGQVTITTPFSSAGSHTITASYAGDTNFKDSSNTLNGGLTVNKAQTAITITSSANSAVVGQSITFAGQVSVLAPGAGTPIGPVILTDSGMMSGTASLNASGQFSITVPLSSVGPHAITASYSGDGNFTGSTGTLTGGQNVNKAATTIAVSSNPSNPAVGQTVTFTAQIGVVAPGAGIPTGPVQFNDNGVSLSAPVTLINGSASLSINTLALGAHNIAAEYYGDPNFEGKVSVPLARSVNSPALQVGTITRTPPTYAGDAITINGSGFSSDPTANEVQVIDDDGNQTTGQVTIATANQLTARVPFGAGSGKVRVVLGPSQSDSPNRLDLGTSISGFVQEAIKQSDGSVMRQGIKGMKLKATVINREVSAVTNDDGSFILKFQPSDVIGNRVDLYLNYDSALPYPAQTRTMRNVLSNRDNQYRGDVVNGVQLANVIELKQNAGPAIGALASNTAINESLRVPAPASSEAVQDGTMTGQVTFAVNDSAVICSNGQMNCPFTITVLDSGRTPANLPVGYFSSAIVQLTPFSTTLSPGGKLTFPNSDSIPQGMPVRVFRFDQTANSPTLGSFVDIGAATFSADGTKIETAANAVTQGGYYFVSRQWLTATIIGHVVETDGRPVRRAVVNARGQSAFTDNNGGFVLGNVPVIPPDGTNDQVTVEISYVRPDGRVDRTQRSVFINANASLTLNQDFALPRQSNNRPPQIIAPLSLVVNEGETRDFNFVVSHPLYITDPTITVSVSGAPFATVLNPNPANNVNRLHLSPGANTAGNYTLMLSATNSLGLVSRQSLAVTVQRTSNSVLVANYLTIATNEDTPVGVALSASNPGGGTLSYTLVSRPAHGSLGGTAPNLIYLPAPNYNGPDSFSFKVSNGSRESNVATVVIAVNPVNDAPVLTVVSATSLSANAGETVKIDLSATDVDVGQTLSFTATGLPPGASFAPTTTGYQFSWTPTFAQTGSYVVNFKVSDDGSPVLSDARSVTITVAAKWAKTTGLEGGIIHALVTKDGNLFAGTEGAGVFISTDNGTSWSAVNAGLGNLYIWSLTVSGTNLFAGTGSGVYRSSDNGATWIPANAGIENETVRSLAVSGSYLFAGTGYDHGVFRSDNNGQTWRQVNNGLGDMTVWALTASGTSLFAGTDKGGIFCSLNNGDQWTPVNSGLIADGEEVKTVDSFAVKGTTLFAGTSRGVFRSTNNGNRWEEINNGFPKWFVLSFAVLGTDLYAGTFSVGLYRSPDNGAHWMQVSSGFRELLFVNSLAVNGSNLFAGTEGSGVFRSPDIGVSWTKTNSGLTNQQVFALALKGSTLYAGSFGGVYRSNNNGTSWELSNNGLDPLQLVYAIAVSGTKLFLGASNDVFRSTDDGLSWSKVHTFETGVLSLAATGNALYAGTFNGVYRSLDDGINWTKIDVGLTNKKINSLAVSGTNIFAGTDNGIFRSSSNGQSWVPANSGIEFPYINTLTVNGATIFAGTSYHGVYQSTNNGLSWAQIGSGLTELRVLSLAVSGSTIFAGTDGSGVYFSTDSSSWVPLQNSLTDSYILSLVVSSGDLIAGTASSVYRLTNNIQSWTPVNSGLTNQFVNTVALSGTNLLAGTLGGGVYSSPNNGQSWVFASTGLPANTDVTALLVSGTQTLAGTFGDGVFQSYNNGNSWAPISGDLANKYVTSLAVSGTTLFAGTTTNPLTGVSGGVYRSMNGGANWMPASNSLTNRNVTSLAMIGTILYTGTEGGVFRSPDNGQTWTPINTNLASLSVRTLTVKGATLFAGTFDGGVFRLNSSGQTWVSVNNNDLPQRLPVFSLAVGGDDLFAGTIYGVFVSTDDGQSWKQINAGLLNVYVTSIAVGGSSLFAGTKGGGVFLIPF